MPCAFPASFTPGIKIHATQIVWDDFPLAAKRMIPRRCDCILHYKPSVVAYLQAQNSRFNSGTFPA
jgi:hypothetical protein